MIRRRAAAAVLGLHLGVVWAVWQASAPGAGPQAAGLPRTPEAAWLQVRLLPAPDSEPDTPAAPQAVRAIRAVQKSTPTPLPTPMPIPIPIPMLTATQTASAPAAPHPLPPVASQPVAQAPSPTSPLAAPAAAAGATPPATSVVMAAESGSAGPAEAAALADRRECPPAAHPSVLRERGIEGEVRLLVRVGADGRAAEVRLQQPSGWRLFDHAAMAQAQACRFLPARRGLQAVESWVEFPVRFSLSG